MTRDLPVLSFRGVTKIFAERGRRIVGLPPLSLEARAGDAVALTGPNGVGKSTALRIAATLVAPTGGRAAVCGHDVVADAGSVRRLIGVSLGSARSFYWRLTARHNLLFLAALCGMPRRRAEAAVTELSGELGLADLLGLRASRLSRGALARLSVARALVHEPRLVILDEPFASVDGEGRALVWRALERRLARGRAVVLSSHDDAAVRRCSVVARLDGAAPT